MRAAGIVMNIEADDLTLRPCLHGVGDLGLVG